MALPSQLRDTGQVVVFLIDDQRYALPLACVERVLPMATVAPLPDAPSTVLGVLNLHGLLVPVLDIRRRIGLPDRRYRLSDHLLVARMRRTTIVLPVDEVAGTIELGGDAIARPDPRATTPGMLAGIGRLRDGLIIIHDLEAFLTPDEEVRLAHSLAWMQS